MAISSVTRAAIEKSTFGHLGENPNARPIDIQRAIYNRLGITDPGDRIRVLNYVRQARELWREGEARQNDPDPSRADRPRGIDHTIDDGITQYRYRVLVEVVDPETGERYSTVVLIDSTRPLSARDARDSALNTWDTIRGRDRHYVSRSDIQFEPEVTATILTAGRASYT